MSNNYELTEPYPLGNFDTAHDVQEGKRRHFTEGRHELWASRDSQPFPWVLAVVIAVGLVLMASSCKQQTAAEYQERVEVAPKFMDVDGRCWAMLRHNHKGNAKTFCEVPCPADGGAL